MCHISFDAEFNFKSNSVQLYCIWIRIEEFILKKLIQKSVSVDFLSFTLVIGKKWTSDSESSLNFTSHTRK